jgi:hypothetical protein
VNQKPNLPAREPKFQQRADLFPQFNRIFKPALTGPEIFRAANKSTNSEIA